MVEKKQLLLHLGLQRQLTDSLNQRDRLFMNDLTDTFCKISRGLFFALSLILINFSINESARAETADYVAAAESVKARTEDHLIAKSACDPKLKKNSNDTVIMLNNHMLYRSKNQCVDGRYGKVCQTFAIDLRSGRCVKKFYAGSLFTITTFSTIEAFYPSFAFPIPRKNWDRSRRPLETLSRSGVAYLFETTRALYVVEAKKSDDN